MPDYHNAPFFAKAGISVSGSAAVTGSLSVADGFTLQNRHLRKIFIDETGTKEEWTGSGDRTY
jgi:hypothetical protein